MTFIMSGIALIGIGFTLAASLPMLAEKSVLAMIGCGCAVCGWTLIWAGWRTHRSKP